jgi:accessory gene regulator protein AgrB
MKISMQTLRKIDKFIIGFIIGLIAPIIVFIIYYKLNYDFIKFNAFVEDAFMKSIFAPLLSLCVIINLGIFYFFYYKYLNYAARGVIGATFVYAIIVFMIKLFY